MRVDVGIRADYVRFTSSFGRRSVVEMTVTFDPKQPFGPGLTRDSPSSNMSNRMPKEILRGPPLSRSLRSGIESDDGRKTLTPKMWASVIERIEIQSH